MQTDHAYIEDNFQFEDCFRQLVPDLTLSALSLSPAVIGPLSRPQNRMLSVKLQQSFTKKTTLMAHCSTTAYLIYAFCHAQSPVMSTFTIQMFSKREPFRSLQKQLRSVDLQIKTIKLAMNDWGELVLLAGSACGRLLTYQHFETGQVAVDVFRFSPHRVVDLVVPTLRNCTFALCANGTIYLIDFKQKIIHFQFQCELPQIQDKDLHLFIDPAERFICCAFSYGRIIIWDIQFTIASRPTISLPAQELQNDLSSEGYHTQPKQKRLAKKQGKEKATRNMVFKPRMNVMSCVAEGIRWVAFFGTFVGVVTEQNTLKILAININSNGLNSQLYLVIKQICLIQKTIKCGSIQSIAHVEKWEHGINVVINRNAVKYGQSGSRLQRYTFKDNFQQVQLEVIDLQDESDLSEACWDSSGRFVLYRGSQGYSLLAVKNKDV